MKPNDDSNLAFRLKGIEAALRRAAAEARELAARTQTPVFVIRQGQIVDLRDEMPKVS